MLQWSKESIEIREQFIPRTLHEIEVLDEEINVSDSYQKYCLIWLSKSGEK